MNGQRTRSNSQTARRLNKIMVKRINRLSNPRIFNKNSFKNQIKRTETKTTKSTKKPFDVEEFQEKKTAYKKKVDLAEILSLRDQLKIPKTRICGSIIKETYLPSQTKVDLKKRSYKRVYCFNSSANYKIIFILVQCQDNLLNNTLEHIRTWKTNPTNAFTW